MEEKIESLDSENHKDWISNCKKNVSYIVRKTDDVACKFLDMVVLETPRETAVYEQVKFVLHGQCKVFTKSYCIRRVSICRGQTVRYPWWTKQLTIF